MDKAIERFYVEKFLECISAAPDTIKNCESPDFILNLNEREIGIELTNLKQNSLSSIAGNQRKIVRNACSKAIQANIEPVDVHVWFYDHEIKNVQSFIKEASEYLFLCIKNSIEYIKSGNGNIVKISCENNKYNIFQITAHWNVINGQRWLDSHRWQTEDPGFVSTEFHDIIQREIRKKNNKLQDYLRRCSECWLLIVIDRSKKDEHFDYDSMKNDIGYISNFHKNYVFDVMERKAYLLMN